MNLKEKDIINVEGIGKMLVQSVGREAYVLMGRKKATSKIEAIVSIEINKRNLSNQNGEVAFMRPYEESKVFNFGKQIENYQSLNEYLERVGV